MDNINLPNSKNRFFLLLLPITGALIVYFSFIIDFYFDFGQIRVRPLHLIILLLWFGCIECFGGKINQFIYIFIGASFAIVVGYFINKGSFIGNFSNLHYLLAAGILGTVLIIPGILFSEKGNFPKKSTLWAIIWLFISFSLVFIFRISNILNRDLPNEARSLILKGVEIHHFISGFLLAGLAFTLLLNFPKNKFIENFFSGLVVVGLGMIADQITYIFMNPLSDDAFFSFFSLLGAILAMCWLVFRLIHLIKKRA